MVQCKGGRFARTKTKLKRPMRDKGKVKIRNYLQEFKEGDKVVIKPDSSYQKGLPFRRFWGKVAVFIEKRGKANVLEIKDGNKTKRIISANVHMKKV